MRLNAFTSHKHANYLYVLETRARSGRLLRRFRRGRIQSLFFFMIIADNVTYPHPSILIQGERGVVKRINRDEEGSDRHRTKRE